MMAETHCPEPEQDFPFPDDIQTTVDSIRNLSGRYDLSDLQVIKHINSGQRHLDRMTQRRQQRTQTMRSVKAGTIGVVFSSRCRSIERAYLISGCDRPRMLRRISWKQMRGHIQAIPTPASSGPTVYTEAILHYQPGGVGIDDVEAVIGYMDTIIGPSAMCNGIVVHPPSTQEIVVEVLGNWYDDILTTEWPYSWWLTNHPDIVEKAALRELEIFMRNKEGVSDYDNAIAADLAQIDHDVAEEENYHGSRMEG